MKGKICLVTGASSGIGEATALGLAKLGATVVMVVRNPEKGRQVQESIKSASGNPSVDLLVADLSSQQSIRQLAKDFQSMYKKLDVLVNNAGGIYSQRRLTQDNIEYTLAVDYLAPFLLTNLLIPSLKAAAPSRVVNVVTKLFKSTKVDLANLQGERKYSGFGAYSQAKLCDIMFTYQMAKKLAGTGVTVNCVHPGMTRSNFGRDTMHLPQPIKAMNRLYTLFLASSAKASEKVVYVASAPELETATGQYYANKKTIKSPDQSYDQEVLKKLWDASIELVNLG